MNIEIFPDISRPGELDFHRLTITRITGKFLCILGALSFLVVVFTGVLFVVKLLALVALAGLIYQVSSLSILNRQDVDDSLALFCVLSVSVVVFTGYTVYDLILLIVPVSVVLFLASKGIVRSVLLALTLIIASYGLVNLLIDSNYVVEDQYHHMYFYINLVIAVLATAIVVFMSVEYNLLVIRSTTFQKDSLHAKIEQRIEKNAALSDYGAQLLELTNKTSQQLAIDRQAVAELQASNEQLEQFCYAASHDLKEPVRTIHSFMEIAKRHLNASEFLDQELLDYFEHVSNNAQAMNALLERLLGFSRLDRHQVASQVESLPDLLKKHVIKPNHAARIDFVVNCPAGTRITTDRKLLVLALKEIVDNASKFIADGQVPKVTLTCTLTDKEIFIHVADNGIGIDPEYQDQIFRMFKRLHPRGVYKGPGIGLSLASRAVEMLGGSISIPSSSHGGSVFRIKLPNT